ncbi:hypothetical protein H3221_016535 [Pseudomonas sp. LMG 31766]|jgi:hypothetical protein|uniref:Uncharacterized protein n=1 Tax=Pseudomonas chaetocerotis TaxID=2758695 RepID=A0A931D8V7_9PSED|nr:hypothetical protein [Pseudomonas chaetocerotis]MBZ9666352.1 hypothetical protein [Pseudomonas chaetocerotis]
MRKHISEGKLLADQVEADLLAIYALSAAIRDDRAHEGCNPPPRLDAEQQDAIHHAICRLSHFGLRAFHDLLNELEVPA